MSSFIDMLRCRGIIIEESVMYKESVFAHKQISNFITYKHCNDIKWSGMLAVLCSEG